MSKKIKKILFLTRLYPPHIGGVERHVEEISRNLVKKDLSITIITEKFDESLVENEKKGSIKIIRIPISLSEKNKKFEIWKWFIKNRGAIRNFDVIHIHDVFYWILPIIFILDRKKLFVTFHGYESFPIKISEKIQKKIAAKYCSGSIAVGEFINKWYNIASNAVIYGGVDAKIIPAKSKKNSLKSIRMLYIGRLSDDMGAKIYADTLSSLKKDKYKFELVVCGDGVYRSEFEKLGRVLGFVKNLEPYINSSDLVFSSSYLTMLEALKLKKPVFSVYGNELKKDYLSNSPFNQYISISSNSKDLKRSIKKSIPASTVEEGYLWSKEQSWNKIAQTYLKLWRI